MSCELALNSMINSWKLSLDINHNVIEILLGFSKAFDTVDHSLLFKKLFFITFLEKVLDLSRAIFLIALLLLNSIGAILVENYLMLVYHKDQF